jgi:RimJ/RimL family protein N-acetyltransferase
MSVLLGTEVDKAGNLLTVYKSEQLGMSPAYSFFLKHYAELIDNGQGYPTTTWNDKTCGVIYAMKADEIVGAIIYDREHPNADGGVWIVLSATSRASRGQGIYNILHRYLETTAKSLNKSSILSFVHVTNTARLRSAEKEGMAPIFYMIGKKLV